MLTSWLTLWWSVMTGSLWTFTLSRLFIRVSLFMLTHFNYILIYLTTVKKGHRWQHWITALKTLWSYFFMNIYGFSPKDCARVLKSYQSSFWFLHLVLLLSSHTASVRCFATLPLCHPRLWLWLRMRAAKKHSIPNNGKYSAATSCAINERTCSWNQEGPCIGILSLN